MSTLKPYRRSIRNTRPRHNGLAAVVLVVALAFLAGLAALAVDLSMVFYSHEQLRAGCEAAALAGAPRLMDRNVLYPSRGCRPIFDEDGDDEDDNGHGGHHLDRHERGDDEHDHQHSGLRAIHCAVGRHEYEQQVLAARRMAIALAHRNRAAGCPIVLDENIENHADGDIVVGWVSHPDRIGSPLEIHDCGPLNTVLARAHRDERRGNPLTMWMGQLLGMPTCDVQALARATLDHRVYGFHASRLACAPVIPIAAPFGMRHDAWPRQAFCEARPHDNDQFTVDPQTGHVTCGSDGIPEIRLCMTFDAGSHHGEHASHHQGDGFQNNRDPHEHESHVCDQWRGHGNAIPLRIGDDENHHAAPLAKFLRQLEHGLSRADLEEHCGNIRLGDCFGSHSIHNRHDALALRQACLDLKGELRAWPLCAPVCGREHRQGWEIIGFAAGRIVAVELSHDNAHECVVVVQPDVMTSSQALVGNCASRNPWIAKVELTQ